MSFPGITTGRNLVVASVQTSPALSPVFQEGLDEPVTRPNGGDLMPGDTWLQPEEETLYVWTGEVWMFVTGPIIDCGNAESYS